MTDRVDSLTSQVQHQETALGTTADTNTITSLRNSIAALQSSVEALQSSSAKVNGTLASYKNCLPQLQTELDGLTIDYNIDWNNGSNDYFWIQNGNQVSTDCSKVLYGTGRGD